MFEILSQSAILTFFLVVALGAAFGQIKFWHLKFGAAGALFVGLALSAADLRRASTIRSDWFRHTAGMDVDILALPSAQRC